MSNLRILKVKTYLVAVELAIGTNIEQAASGIIGTSAEGISVGKELNSVDVGFVTSKCLHGLASTDIPQLGEGVTGTGDEDVLVGWVDANRHHITQMIGKLGNLGARFDIPQHTSHVTRRSDDAAIIDKAAAGEVTGVARKLARNPSRAFARGQIVDGADVIQTTTSDIVTARRIGTSHDPG